MGCFWFFSCTGRRQFDSTSGFSVPKRCPFIRRTQTPRFHPEDTPSYRPRLHFLHSFLLHICKIFLFKKTKKEKYTQAGKQARALSLLPAVSLHARTRSRTSKPAARRAARNRAGSVKARCGFPQGGCKLILLPSALLVWASRRAPALCDGPLGSVSPQPPARPNATLRRDMIRD